ncbi:transposase (plasmid) [Xenorhabdus nematophila AN6/1]|nr:transposase [Xenorhabdus nematophila AN6/1]
MDTSLPAEIVIRVLERLKIERGLPQQIRVDNGPELIPAKLLNYCDSNNIELCHIQPGKPQQNGFIECFNGSFRRKFLKTELFESLSQVKEIAWFWQQDYNKNRPHVSSYFS